MKELAVKNYKTTEGQKMGQDGNTFTVKPLFPNMETGRCAAAFVEVKPGNFAFSYHYHEINEEIFYIISGEGIVKTQKGEIKVKAGDAITFPAGAKGSHVIRNSSNTETLLYLDFGAVGKADIVHLLDSKKVMAMGPFSHYLFDEK
ncbi:MAG: cupin domain-containing protein [Elusimicrobiota bacterium]|jgi:uncharacterized cupin superfamily protein|nr:cupin domain-containing protein [Elusimicrobiota bacterium]